MSWKNTMVDELPHDNEEVLISVNGVNYIAIYNITRKGFEVKSTNSFYFINDKHAIIYWLKLPQTSGGLK